jgi:hypothetical protein
VIAASLLVAFATLAGRALLDRLGGLRGEGPFLRLAAAVPVGLCVFGLIGFVLAWVLGMRPWTPWVAAVAPAVSLVDPRGWGHTAAEWKDALLRLGRHRVEAATAVVLMLGLAYLFSGALIQDSAGIATTDHHNLGDLPFHLAVLDGFAYGDNFPPEHPELAGNKLTYPFLVDLIAALLVVGGAGLRDAFLVENVTLAFALLVALRGWAWTVTRDRLAAWLAPLLFLLNGGLGFVLVAHKAYVSERGLIGTALHPPLDATISTASTGSLGLLRWGNLLTTTFLTQRAFLLGLPLFLVAALLWWRALEERRSGADPAGVRRMLTAGVIAGLLPLVHAHTLVAVMALALVWTPRFQLWRRPWRQFFVAAAIVGLPQVIWMASGSQVQAGRFFAWEPGWESGLASVWRTSTSPWTPIPAVLARFTWFWLANTGLVFPLLAVALLWRGHRPLLRRGLGRYLLPFASFFIVANLFRMAPWMWDNVKVLVFAFLGVTPVLALLLARLWRAPSAEARWAASALCLALVAAGGLDVIRVARGVQRQQIFTSEDVAFAAQIRAHTPPRARILNAPTYNHPLWLTGRRSLLGYPGHIFSHGLDAGDRENEIRRMYQGAPEAGSLLAKNAIDFVAVGPQERQLLIVNDDFLAKFPLVAQTGSHRLYRVDRR